MASYDDRPWLKHYDEKLKPEIPIPDISYAVLLEKSFDEFADRPALYFLGVTKKYKEVDDYSCRFANFLSNIGCGQGDVVGINLPNVPEYLYVHAGTLRAGCTATGVSPLLTPKELTYQINDSGARVLITLDILFDEKLLKIKDKVPNLTHIVVLNVADSLPAYKRFLGKLLKKVPTAKIVPVPGKTILTLKEIFRKYPPNKPKVTIDPDSNCLIQYTGGTTGLPKGTELTHRNMVANMLQVTGWGEMEPGKESYCCAFPFFHLAGLSIGMVGMAMGFAQILVPDPRNTKHIVKEVAKYKPTVLGNVPSLYQMLLETPGFKELDFSQCRACMSGAAPFSVESIHALEEVVGEGNVLEVFGMTEASPILTMNPEKGLKKVGSVGLPVQNTMLKLIDLDTGTKEVPFGEEGEIIARGPQIMKGYFNKPEETDHALREFNGERWFHTGDIGKMDEDGFLYIVDRAKDMIIVGGYKVFSREAEESLYEHPAVEFCAFVGIPNPKRPGSELVKAVVQLSTQYKGKDPKELEKDILAYCKENMAPYKVPKIIQFVDEIPLTAVGKVDKKLVRNPST